MSVTDCRIVGATYLDGRVRLAALEKIAAGHYTLLSKCSKIKIKLPEERSARDCLSRLVSLARLLSLGVGLPVFHNLIHGELDGRCGVRSTTQERPRFVAITRRRARRRRVVVIASSHAVICRNRPSHLANDDAQLLIEAKVPGTAMRFECTDRRLPFTVFRARSLWLWCLSRGGTDGVDRRS